MATTTYLVFVNDVKLDATQSKKAKAIEVALQERNDKGANVRVETVNGKVVFEAKAPKKIKMSPRYTRVVPLPEGVVVPDGMRVAYFRPRRNAAVLHDGEQYFILDTATNELSEDSFETTRDAGRALIDG